MSGPRDEPVPPPATDEPDPDVTLAVERGRRKDVLGRLRSIVRDAQAVERRVVDDYARADLDRRGRSKP